MDPPLRLTPRDAQALRWVGEQYTCRLDQFAEVLGRIGGREPLSLSATRAVVGRWVGLSLAGRARLLVGEPEWVWLTTKGLRAAELPFGPWEPKAWTVRHMGAVNRVRLFIEPRRPGARWRPERELRATRPDRRLADASPIPDGELLDAGGNVIAIEVELSPKSITARRRAMQALVAHYEAIWYFASADCWAAVHDAACTVPPQLGDLVRIYALEDL
ncbi:MAG TPA: hypothetical protein VFW71_16970 [Actinomycetota bacterium]|nr:hypothetical protein [Actinomycetota bacterium]